jgi:hypothetical protein
MKSLVFATLSSLTLLTAAFAQSGVLVADIPFEFRVGTTLLPAGHYSVHPQASTHILSIQCFECNAAAMILTNGVEARKMPVTAKLVFNRYGNKYFLATVWTPGNPTGRELPKSAAEREVARNGSVDPPVQVALYRR